MYTDNCSNNTLDLYINIISLFYLVYFSTCLWWRHEVYGQLWALSQSILLPQPLALVSVWIFAHCSCLILTVWGTDCWICFSNPILFIYVSMSSSSNHLRLLFLRFFANLFPCISVFWPFWYPFRIFERDLQGRHT